jgi:hypothetical protein
MTAAELVSALASRGVQLVAEGERLRWRPAGAVSAEEREALVHHKAELLALLRRQPAAPAAPTSVRLPGSLEEEVAQEKEILAKRIAACPDQDLRRRLEVLAREEPEGLDEALDWHERVKHWEGEWRRRYRP